MANQVYAHKEVYAGRPADAAGGPSGAGVTEEGS